MDLTCMRELPGLDWAVLLVAVVVGLILFVLGIYLLLRPRPSPTPNTKHEVETTIDKYGLKGPAGVFLILLSIALFGGLYWQLNSRFPANAEEFSGAPRTLGSIAEGLRRNSSADILLKGGAETVVISQPVSGACWSALVDKLCAAHRETLTCSRDGDRIVIDRKP